MRNQRQFERKQTNQCNCSLYKHEFTVFGTNLKSYELKTPL